MQPSIHSISLLQLSIAFIPVFIALWIMYHASLNTKKASYALSRMLLQLLLVGYFLSYIFDSNSSIIILLVLIVMLLASSWIALDALSVKKKDLYAAVLLAIIVGGGGTLLLITQGVLQLNPWYSPAYMIPLAGMIFANSMTSISLAAERLYAELARGEAYAKAKHVALQAALIPVINSLLAVGLVSLPGMMTGQILSGVSPLIAARYQIMVMCMIFASSVISSALFLKWLPKKTSGLSNDQ